MSKISVHYKIFIEKLKYIKDEDKINFYVNFHLKDGSAVKQINAIS